MENIDNNPARILVGTSGYAYSEWVDAGFYPPGTGSARMLAHYARVFPVTEINYTWYQMPKAPAMDRMRRKAPEGFRFAAKLTRTLTHEVDANGWPAQAALYREGVAPLVQSGQLLAVLVQLPPFFRRNPENRRYLARLLDALSGLPLVVEFRHASWATDRVFASLKERRVTLACVDAPELKDLFPPLAMVTNPDLFYIRFPRPQRHRLAVGQHAKAVRLRLQQRRTGPVVPVTHSRNDPAGRHRPHFFQQPRPRPGTEECPDADGTTGGRLKTEDR